MAEETIEYPFSDDELKWNEARGRYEANPQLALNRNIDLNELDDFGSLDKGDLHRRFMVEMTNDVYRAILTKNPNKLLVEYHLAKTEKYRELLKDWVIYQMIYVMTGGRTGEHTGFNASTGKVVKLSALRGDRKYSASMLDEMRIDGILRKNFSNVLILNKGD